MCANFGEGMNINQYLKSIGKTKTELADELRVSRPTLNLYIEAFESGQKIENERYDIIFKCLFSDRTGSKELFDRKMVAVKSLLERDEKYDIGCLEPEAADMVVRIHNNMVHDMSTGDWNRKLYDFILIFLSNYKDSAVMRELAGYFSDLNSDSELSELSIETKAYYAYFFKCFSKIVDDAPPYDQSYFEAFSTRKEQIRGEREKRNIEKKNNIKAKLDNIINEVEFMFRENGIDATEEELTTEIMRRLNGSV